MSSKTRVLKTLKCEIPDKVPYMYSTINPFLQEKIVGKELKNYEYDLNRQPSTILSPGEESEMKIDYRIHPETARMLKLDAVGFNIMPPFFCRTKFVPEKGHQVAEGLINSREVLEKIVMPDPDREEIYREIEDFVNKFQGEFAIFAGIRMGYSPVLLSMGYDNFSYKLYEDKAMVKEVVKMYTDWNKRMIKNLLETDIDFLWNYGDIAYKNGPIFSPETLREIFLPYITEVTDMIDIPWIYHSDGNIEPVLDDLLSSMKMSGIHPLEPGTMDLKYLKKEYGNRLCLVGNVDINKYLTTGTEAEIEEEVRRKINMLGPGGGFIISDSNSVPYHCKPEKVIAMSKAVQKYRSIY